MAKKKKYTYAADSWDAFIADLKSKPHHPAWNDDQSSIGVSEDFAGSRSWEHSLELAEQGCPATREAVDSASFKVAVDRLPEFDFAPVGVFPCIPAYAAGAPEDMFTPSEWGQEIPKPVVQIYVNITASGCVDKEYLINRGAAIVQLIDRVQLAGQRVELVGCFHAKHGDNTFDFSVVIKRPEEIVDLDRIAYAVAHPSMLRRSMFRIMECVADYRVGGYGTPTDLKENIPPSAVYIKSMLWESDDFETRDRAKVAINGVWDKAAQAA